MKNGNVAFLTVFFLVLLVPFPISMYIARYAVFSVLSFLVAQKSFHQSRSLYFSDKRLVHVL